MKKLEYSIEEKYKSFLDKEDINLYLSKLSQTKSNWWDNLKPFYYTDAKNWLQNIRDLTTLVYENRISLSDINNITQNRYGSTAKKCPAISAILSKSFLIKSPCDIYVSVKNGKIEHCVYSESKLIASIDSHSEHQYNSEKHNVFENHKSLKISLPIILKSDVPYVFLNPTYHGINNFYVLPGVIENQYAKYMELVIHGMIDVSRDYDFMINCGDIIAYMWFPEKMKLSYNPKIKDKRGFTKYNLPRNYFGKN